MLRRPAALQYACHALWEDSDAVQTVGRAADWALSIARFRTPAGRLAPSRRSRMPSQPGFQGHVPMDPGPPSGQCNSKSIIHHPRLRTHRSHRYVVRGRSTLRLARRLARGIASIRILFVHPVNAVAKRNRSPDARANKTLSWAVTIPNTPWLRPFSRGGHPETTCPVRPGCSHHSRAMVTRCPEVA
ncbi:hypothetical protein BD311DRAFT_753001 [Dichomitus squalens]|uniref:Uncharacterized protein n=1 Tax=Dichomitus squalens TaxID=114155 RepID=A0A4V2K143_9APHY|nr:hypothetical protein BD311DRAFT_753001 [Dichomitus squalens]